ncbi:MAG: peptidyl-prolyl cis-trans isomerase [Chloroflexi bacterium]|nr:peptidyl-prolyl cis-trans isomerase [Chloroflexota bacterium]
MRLNVFGFALLALVLVLTSLSATGFAQGDPTPTPYAVPTNGPDVDDDLVITRVGEVEITLADFQKRVRFERWFRLYQLTKQVEKHGPEVVLDLTDPANEQVASLFATLADSNGFGIQVHRVMVINELTLQEADRRGLEVDQPQFNSRLAQFLGEILVEGGQFAPGFDDEYAIFLEEMALFTGMTEAEFLRIVEATTLFKQLELIVGQEANLTPDETMRVGLEIEDVIVADETLAGDIAARLAAGVFLVDIAADLDLALETEDGVRIFRWDDDRLTADVFETVNEAAPGDIIGPFPVESGWYVGRVGLQVFQTLTPQEIEEARKQYFRDWITAQLDDPAVVVDLENWLAHIPQEPLPQDVSPLLRDENVILPE